MTRTRLGCLAPLALGVALLGSSPAASSPAASFSLPRATADRPDDVAGAEIHVVYAVPSDGQDRALDTNGAAAASVGNFESWLSGQTGGRRLRLDTSGGEPDITFFRMSETNAQVAANGAFVREAIERELHAAGFDVPWKIYAVYYDGSSTYACGGGAWPPSLPGNVAALYLRATYGRGYTCYDPNASFAGLQIMDFAIVHEVMHTIGFVPTCAPHHTRFGHVSDSPTDLMYAGDQPWYPSVLDFGRDDYFGAHIPGCPDLADSPYLTGGSASVAVSLTGAGRGKVTSSPAGVNCASTCTSQLERGLLVTLKAAPAPGTAFAGWSGACAGTAACSFVLDVDKTVTARFLPQRHRLTIAVTGRGRVTGSRPGLGCTRRCSTVVPATRPIVLRATPAAGWRFARWTGACKSARPTCTLTMRQDRIVRAVFARRRG